MRFAERPGTDPAKRPIREIVGVDPRLNQRWSTRRAHINTRRSELAIQFQKDHGRPPTPVEAFYGDLRVMSMSGPFGLVVGPGAVLRSA